MHTDLTTAEIALTSLGYMFSVPNGLTILLSMIDLPSEG